MAVGGEITIKTGTTPGTPSAGNITLWADADGTLQALQSSGSSSGMGMYSAYMKCSDVKSQNTGGGTFTASAWRTRDINTEDADTGGNMSISSNQITLDAGTYRCLARCPAHDVGHHQAQLYNISGSATTLIGTSEWISATDNIQSSSIVTGRFTVAAETIFEIQHWCSDTGTFGVQVNITSEVYTVAEFWKEA